MAACEWHVCDDCHRTPFRRRLRPRIHDDEAERCHDEDVRSSARRLAKRRCGNGACALECLVAERVDNRWRRLCGLAILADGQA